MARIGIFTCANATQNLGCSSVSCITDLRKRKGAFAEYPKDEPLDLVGIITCPGCLTFVGPEKLLKRIRALTEFHVDAIHFSYCVKALCPFKARYEESLKEAFPDIKIIIGTHEEHIEVGEFRERVRRLCAQPEKSMVDIIKKTD